MDFSSMSFGAVAGTVVWELSKYLFNHKFKRHSDEADTKRRMLREDIESIAGLACDLTEHATIYYSLPFDTEKAQELSRLIKAKIKVTGMKLHAVSVQFEKLNRPKIDLSYWTAYKYAATANLDVTRKCGWQDSDPRLKEIHRCAHYFLISINKSRYECT